MSFVLHKSSCRALLMLCLVCMRVTGSTYDDNHTSLLTLPDFSSEEFDYVFCLRGAWALAFEHSSAFECDAVMRTCCMEFLVSLRVFSLAIVGMS